MIKMFPALLVQTLPLSKSHLLLGHSLITALIQTLVASPETSSLALPSYTLYKVIVIHFHQ